MIDAQIKWVSSKKLMKEVNRIRIPSTNNNYINTIKKDELNGLSPNLLLDKNKQSKAKYEIKKENSYIRHYVTNINSERVMIKEIKLPKGQDTGQSAGEMPDVLIENLLKQFTKIIDHQKSPDIFKTGLAGQKANSILSKFNLSMLKEK